MGRWKENSDGEGKELQEVPLFACVLTMELSSALRLFWRALFGFRQVGLHDRSQSNWSQECCWPLPFCHWLRQVIWLVFLPHFNHLVACLTYLRFAQQQNPERPRLFGKITIPQLPIHPFRVFQISSRLVEQLNFYATTASPILFNYSWQMLTRKRLNDDQTVLYDFSILTRKFWYTLWKEWKYSGCICPALESGVKPAKEEQSRRIHIWRRMGKWRQGTLRPSCVCPSLQRMGGRYSKYHSLPWRPRSRHDFRHLGRIALGLRQCRWLFWITGRYPFIWTLVWWTLVRSDRPIRCHFTDQVPLYHIILTILVIGLLVSAATFH